MEIAPTGDGHNASFHGYGFNVGTTLAGRVTYSHCGAFGTGAATAFKVVPSTDVARSH